MISDQSVANYLVSLYSGKTSEFAHYDPGATDGVCWATAHFDDSSLILLRGSVLLRDWLRDLEAVADPFRHDALGPVHPGFLVGMHELWEEIKVSTPGPYVVAGHSLGAGRACVLAGIMVNDATVPLRLVRFGEPKPGFQKLADLLKPIPGASYRNGDQLHHDLVTDVPLSFPPEEYVHPSPLQVVCAPPNVGLVKQFGAFAWHHMPLYAEALNK